MTPQEMAGGYRIDPSSVKARPLEPDELAQSIAGLRTMKPITISGRWEGELPWPPVTRRVVLFPRSIRLWRLLLWTERFEFDAVDDYRGGPEVEMRAAGPVTRVQAERWRRALYYALWPFWRVWRVTRHVALRLLGLAPETEP